MANEIALETKIDLLFDKVDGLAARIDKVESRLDGLDGKVDWLKTKLTIEFNEMKEEAARQMGLLQTVGVHVRPRVERIDLRRKR